MMPKIELLPVVIDIETTGLDSLEHEILAIGIKWGRKENCEKVFCRDKDTSEFSVIYKTLITLGQFLSPAIVGYNITNFDIPFIAARATKLGMDASIIRRLPRVDLTFNPLFIETYNLFDERSQAFFIFQSSFH